MVFHRSLSDSMSPQVSRTLLSILADLNNAVVLLFPSPLVPLSIFWRLYRVHRLQGLSSSLSSSIAFFSVLLQGSGTYLCFCFPSVLPCGQPRQESQLLNGFFFFFFFFWLSVGLVVWPKLGDPFVFQTPREFSASHFRGRTSGYADTICSYGEI